MANQPQDLPAVIRALEGRIAALERLSATQETVADLDARVTALEPPEETPP